MTQQQQDLRRILICEDDEGITEVASIVLKGIGYDVRSVMTGSKILPMVKEWLPHLILLDLWMPELSAVEVVSQLKESLLTHAIPVIIVSADRETPRIAEEIGATDYISKPFDIEVLEKKVALYCPLQKATSQVATQSP